jgi:Zn-dependent peptidase ImmA (M78 family)/predicted secreted protein
VINFRLAHVTAMKLAYETHKRLATDLSEQVDVFGAIRRLGIPLAFVPLEGLSGAFVPALDDTNGQPGILVNSNHPRSRQRYSAGHELGHYLRDDKVAYDVGTDLLARSRPIVKDQREAVAESFAAWFLMPRPLVDYKLTQLSIPSEPTPEDAYRLSLALGTSYLATVAHLLTVKAISREHFKQLAAVPPKWIKSQVAAHGPGDSWGDVWLVRESEGDVHLTPRPGDEIVVELNENPSTGHVWKLDHEPTQVRLVESNFEPSGELNYGAPGERRMVLRVEQAGTFQLRLVKVRPWLTAAAPTKTLTLSIAAEARQETPLPALA